MQFWSFSHTWFFLPSAVQAPCVQQQLIEQKLSLSRFLLYFFMFKHPLITTVRKRTNTIILERYTSARLVAVKIKLDSCSSSDRATTTMVVNSPARPKSGRGSKGKKRGTRRRGGRRCWGKSHYGFLEQRVKHFLQMVVAAPTSLRRGNRRG